MWKRIYVGAVRGTFPEKVKCEIFPPASGFKLVMGWGEHMSLM